VLRGISRSQCPQIAFTPLLDRTGSWKQEFSLGIQQYVDNQSIQTILLFKILRMNAAIATGIILSLGFYVTGMSHYTKAEEIKEIESRVRTFWAYFSVDRMATSIVGINCTIPWHRVRSREFSTILSAEATLNEIAFDHECRMWHLWDSSMDQV
jgi:hypothetical protein